MYRTCKKHLSHLKDWTRFPEEIFILVLADAEAEAEVAKQIKQIAKTVQNVENP